jgi:hypothetical protein
VNPNPHENVTPIDPLAKRKEAAQERVRAALDHLQEAQALVDRAGQELCDVIGLCPEWTRLGTLYDQVKRNWWAVSTKAQRLSRQGRLLLDHEPGVPKRLEIRKRGEE